MNRWEGDIPYDELNELALKLSRVFNQINDNIIKVSGIPPKEVAESFIKGQSKLLGFDEEAEADFRRDIEDKNVYTFSQQNIFMTCILTSAVALSIYKKQPKTVTGPRAFSSKFLQPVSTNSLSLLAFATASFYAVLGTAAFKKISKSQKIKKNTFQQKASIIGRAVKGIKGKISTLRSR